MFITAERIGHSKISDIASLMRTALRAIQLVKHRPSEMSQVQSVSKLISQREVKRKIMYRDIITC